MKVSTRRTLWTRRHFIARGLAAAVLAGLAPARLASAAGKLSGFTLLERLPRPEELETPLEYLESFKTPNEVFFVRSHFGPPEIDPNSWRLEFEGMVERARTFSLEELRRFPVVTIPAVLQCAGNGRSFYTPKVPGVQWGKGALGNAEWTGVRLRDVLHELRPLRTATHIQSVGYDLPPMPTTPSFVRSLPLDRALDPTTILALEMNRAPLPTLHGGPCRLVVPGWAGDHWLKWLGRITLQDHEARGFYMETAYRLSRKDQVGTPPSITVNPVKSIIARPTDGSIIRSGKVTISGVAFSGGGAVERVEVSFDGGAWVATDVGRQTHPGAWQLWRHSWRPPKSGIHTIAVRATDRLGNTQPEQTPWNKGGYLWNGIDRIRCEVRS